MIISKKIVAFFLVMVMCVCSVGIVYAAATTYSTYRNFNVNFSGSTRNYDDRAIQDYNSTQKSLQSRAYIMNKNSISHPAGYYGIQNQMCNGSGACIYSSTWWYSSNACVGLEYGAAYYQKTPGNYRSNGAVAVYNGNTYTYDFTTNTPYTTL